MFRMIISSLFVLAASAALAADVDLEKSTVQWTGSKITGSIRTGTILPKTVNVQLSNGVISSAQLEMDLHTLTVSNLTGEKAKKFLRHMKADDFFDVERFPTALLTITIQDGVARGRLTVKDKTHPVMFPVQRSDKIYSGQLKFDRTKFGIVYKSASVFKNLGDKVIRDEVVIDFKIVLK